MSTPSDADRMAMIEAKLKELDEMRRADPTAHAAAIASTLPTKNCSMCRVEFRGHGNNAKPILDGVVCDDCNVNVVRQRMRAMK